MSDTVFWLVHLAGVAVLFWPIYWKMLGGWLADQYQMSQGELLYVRVCSLGLALAWPVTLVAFLMLLAAQKWLKL